MMELLKKNYEKCCLIKDYSRTFYYNPDSKTIDYIKEYNLLFC
ncbi:DUF2963 domain-containing protein [Candidatus Phytoplasma asteris]